MNIKIEFSDARLLLAAASCAGVNDVRFYLNGVRICPAPFGGVVMQGTDGHRICIAHDFDAKVDGELPPEGIIVSCARFPKPSRAIGAYKAELLLLNGRLHCFTFKKENKMDKIFPAEVIDGKMPALGDFVRSVCGDKGAGIANLESKYLEMAAQVGKMFDAPQITVRGKLFEAPLAIRGLDGESNLAGSARICFHDRHADRFVFYVIMKVHSDAPENWMPDWLDNWGKEETAREQKEQEERNRAD